jgi:hypothetical protein
MKTVLILVEGQTEETIVGDTLNPHLAPRGVVLQPVILKTKREKSGKTFKGGVSSFAQVERDLRALLGKTSAVAATTFIDYYGLPQDFPGLDSRPSGDPYARVAHTEDAFAMAIGNRRFIPHLTLHEVEAWVFADPSKCDWVLGGPSAAMRLTTIRDQCGGAERINEEPDTAPSKRLLGLVSSYQKPFHSPLAVGEIGMRDIRAVCPHADQWLVRIEALGG